MLILGRKATGLDFALYTVIPAAGKRRLTAANSACAGGASEAWFRLAVHRTPCCCPAALRSLRFHIHLSGRIGGQATRLVMMKADATLGEIGAMCRKIEEMAYRAHPIAGSTRTA
jgi:hypothetical protein